MHCWVLWQRRHKLCGSLIDARFSSTEEGPAGSVQEIQQHLFGRRELHNQPDEGRVHRNHFKQHGRAAQTLRDQGPRPQKDLQQREQDRQDGPDSFPRAVWDLQPGLLGHVSEQGAED